MFRRRNRRLKIRVKGIVNHAAFYWLIMVCVTLNTIPLILQHAGQPTFLQDLQGKVVLGHFPKHLCSQIAQFLNERMKEKA